MNPPARLPTARHRSLLVLLTVLTVLAAVAIPRGDAQSVTPPAPPSGEVPSSPGSTLPPQLSEEQMATLESQMASLSEQIKEANLKRAIGLVGIIRDAAGGGRSAAGFYADCYKVVRFDWEDKSRSEFLDWEKSNEDWLYDRRAAAAFQLQLNWLALTLQVAVTKDYAKAFSDVLRHVDQVLSLSAPPGSRDFVYKSDGRSKPRNIPFPGGGGAGSIYARCYDLQWLLGDLPNWEPDAFNIGGIYDQTILPYMRAETPERLMSAWQKRIDGERRLAAAMEGAAEYNFERLTLFELQWSMLKDQYLLSPTTVSVGKMLAHINAHKQTHPAAGTWITELHQMLNPSAAPPETNPFRSNTTGK